MGNPFGSNGDDKKPDGVSTYPADAHDLQSYRDASQQLSQLSTPILLNSSNPHERIFIAAFDGTGNDMSKDEKTGHMTNVALFTKQIQSAIGAGNQQIAYGYVEGAGTQKNVITRALDGATGYTYEQRMEEMYEKFIRQSDKWLQEDPNAQIRLVSTGFSRGAEQAAGFTRMVDERGIQDITGVSKTRDEEGNRITQYTKPPLVEPGQVTQAVALFDPVGTGTPRDYDRRLPPSVISGFQITSEDERRNLFKSTNIIDPGFSENNHFLNVTVGGAHSDVGGSYKLNGLGIRSGNLMSDYLNSLSDKPFLQKQAEPTDPSLNVVHRSEEHQWFYRTSAFDKTGERVRVDEVAPKSIGRNGADINNKELRDEAMAQRFTERQVPIAPEPSSTQNKSSSLDPSKPSHPDHRVHSQCTDAVHRLDAQMGRTPDAVSDRMAASLTVLAKKEGIEKVDAAVLSNGNANSQPGENVFIVQGKWGDPASQKASMPTAQAAATPVEKSFADLEALNSQASKVAAQKPEHQMPIPEAEPKAISR